VEPVEILEHRAPLVLEPQIKVLREGCQAEPVGVVAVEQQGRVRQEQGQKEAVLVATAETALHLRLLDHLLPVAVVVVAGAVITELVGVPGLAEPEAAEMEMQAVKQLDLQAQ
jgi:hypothetical protein